MKTTKELNREIKLQRTQKKKNRKGKCWSEQKKKKKNCGKYSDGDTIGIRIVNAECDDFITDMHLHYEYVVAILLLLLLLVVVAL